MLARFAGFGPVALSIFPDPVTGRYKDANWQHVGEELQSLLSPDEYDSAKRTTFNAFYTSPTVITAMHDAIERLGVPGDATILEPGCGTGNFMRYGRPGLRFIGVELDQSLYALDSTTIDLCLSLFPWAKFRKHKGAC